MNANAVAKNYDRLTPKERHSLILAASDRGDDAEMERLARAAGRLVLRMQDHLPYSQSFREVATLVFIELAEEAACYNDALDRAYDIADIFDEEEATAKEAADVEPPDSDERGQSKGPRTMDLARAAAFVLGMKADGWRMFCERLNLPAYLLWRGLPGIDRLQRSLALAKEVAFTGEGMVQWMNRVRPQGEPERTAVPLTVEGVADATARMFQERVKWWSG